MNGSVRIHNNNGPPTGINLSSISPLSAAFDSSCLNGHYSFANGDSFFEEVLDSKHVPSYQSHQTSTTSTLHNMSLKSTKPLAPETFEEQQQRKQEQLDSLLLMNQRLKNYQAELEADPLAGMVTY